MKKLFWISLSATIMLLASCVSNNNKQATEDAGGTHKVVVKEVLQAGAYTYLNVTENGTDQWIAVTKIDANVGDVFYFEGFMEMNDFKSKDLGRTFESVYFIQDIQSENQHNINAQINKPLSADDVANHKGKPDIEKESIEIKKAKGAISLAELFGNLQKYDGKKVKITGKVVKVNMEIMGKNWYHIQDGTSADGEFDLTITSTSNGIKEGDIITFEGKIVLNKDFGYGYAYKVIMEDGVAI